MQTTDLFIDQILQMADVSDAYGGIGPKSAGPRILEQPFRFLDEVREKRGSVFEVDGGVVDGLDLMYAYHLDPAKRMFMVLDFESNYEVLRDASIYAQAYETSMVKIFGPAISNLNPPEHTKYRALVATAFNRVAVESLANDFIEPVALGLIERMARGNKAELIRQFCAPLPFVVIAHVLGLPADRYSNFAQQTRDMMAFGTDEESWDRCMKAVEDMETFFNGFIEERTANPGDDLISKLIEARVDGERLDHEHLLAFCKLLTPSGMETTARAMSSLMVGLLQNRDQLELLQGDPALLPNAVEEGLRWEGSSLSMPKLTTQATTLNGVEIPAGAYVIECHGYANRDPARWDHPHDLDVRRERKPHVTFAVGPHSCIGNQLARIELQAGIGHLVKHFPNIRLDPDFPPPKITGWNLRGPSAVHVRLD